MDKESPMQSEGLSLPGKIGAIPVANRIVMSPLTRARADKEGKQTALAVDYYR
jgi:N-ethylmaleimide reductase